MAVSDGIPALAALGVTFGGFSPTAMGGVEASRKQIEHVQAETAKKKQADKRRRELEMARTSKPQRYIDDLGTTWVYVVVDDRVVRIVGCETQSATLMVPAEIDARPVYAIAPDACARLDTVKEVFCPESIEVIGSCAFRLCPELKRVTFPKTLGEYSSTWLQHCPKLEELVLPGELSTLKAEIFDNRNLKQLSIGAYVRDIEPGAFQNTRLEALHISPDNLFIATDGDAIYSIDGTCLLALARPVSSYSVREGCTLIGKKACFGAEQLKSIQLPEGITELAPFAFSHTGLCGFTAPSSLKTVGEKAFYYCKQLCDIHLNDGVLSIGDSAFEESGLRALYIPASIDSIGNSITARTPVVHAGPHCTLQIDPASKKLFLDGEGGLYRHEPDGSHLVQLLDREAEAFSVAAGTVCIDQYAFARHEAIRRVSVPEGVLRIEAHAFRHCTNLRQVDLPSSISFIGDFAFIDTSLESICIPRALQHLGSDALVTKGAHRGEDVPSLREITVEEGNERFYVTQGMLCRREEDGDHVVVFNSAVEQVVFPPQIVGIDAYAFNNARGIRYLSLNKELRTISTAGLTTWCWIEDIHVELAEPLEGRTEYDFRFPNTPKSVHGICQGIGGATWVHVPGIMAQLDNCLAMAHDYHSPKNPDNISIYEQVTRILERLQDPIMLTRMNRIIFERLLRDYILDICVDVARHDDRSVIDCLVDMGFINQDNLEDVIMAVSRLQDAAMTGYLLEMKRRRFGRAAFDFDL